MHKLIRLTWVPAVLVLSACDVQLRDTTPAGYPANHDIGMYEVSAVVSHETLVTPGSVFVFALGDKQRVPLNSNADGSSAARTCAATRSSRTRPARPWHTGSA